MLDTLDLNQLKTFYLSVKYGTFSRTAEKLKLSQSAVTRQIQRLERKLGFEVFKRSSRYLILTERGDILYRAASQLFEQILAINTALSNTGEQEEGLLVVTTTHGIAASLLAPYIHEFMAKYPKLHIEIAGNDSVLNLNLREADIAIRPRVAGDPHLIHHHLVTFHTRLYASRDYLEKHGTPTTIEDLKNHQLLAFGDRMKLSRDNVNWHLYLNESIRQEPYFSLNGMALRIAADNGLGIVPWEVEMVNQNPGNLVPVLPEVQGPNVDIYFIYHKDVANFRKIHLFKEFYEQKIIELFGPQRPPVGV